jgi:hypothetical protein
MEFNGTIHKGGKLTIHRRKLMDGFLLSLVGDEEVQVVVSIEKVKRKRSTGLNAYYWGVVIVVINRGLNELGHDVNKDETHEFLKTNFCYEEIVNENTGEILRRPLKTSEFTGGEMWGYIERCSRFAAEYLNEVIPMPGEQAEIFEK